MVEKTIIVICGPTAIGKTAFAIQLATALNTKIISADSRQCFKELNIGVAKPSNDELAAVDHYFINSHSIYETVNAAIFEAYALQAASDIFVENNVAVMVGGTGLYIKAFCNGLDPIPAVNPQVREQVLQTYNHKGLAYLQHELSLKDPGYFSIAEQQNPHRLIRALEVFLSTGSSILSFQSNTKVARPFKIIKIGLHTDRSKLYHAINTRVVQMIDKGLIEEVQNLYDCKNLGALQTVGYTEVFEYFDGNYSLPDAISKIQTNTRHYAKRQLTWFNKDKDIIWFNTDSLTVNKVLHLLHHGR